LFIFSPEEYTLYFQSFITTVSLSSNVVNSVATFHKAFISLDRKTSLSQTHITIGLHSFTPISTQGFSLSITAIEYAHTSFLVTFSIVETISPSNNFSINFAITSVSVSQ
jgi:phage terminase large subunit-like protein